MYVSFAANYIHINTENQTIYRKLQETTEAEVRFLYFDCNKSLHRDDLINACLGGRTFSIDQFNRRTR